MNPMMVENYVTQERGKEMKLLQKFVDACHDSKVKKEIILVEGDNIAEAILGLIPILNIRKLVVGTTKSSLRYNLQTTTTIPKKFLFSKALSYCLLLL